MVDEPNTLPTPEEFGALASSGLFLSQWYSERYKVSAVSEADLLMEFCCSGWRRGQWPNPYFDSNWYLASNPDVQRAGTNPVSHYLFYGDREGRRPVTFFDPHWYRVNYGVSHGETCLQHFLSRRLSGTVTPMPEFDSGAYLRRYPEIALAQEDPFLAWHSGVPGQQLSDVQLLARSGLFDATYYLINNPDVRDNKTDPLVHFCNYGWREFRNPNMYFDIAWYMSESEAFLPIDVNPLFHYYLHGELNNFRPSRYFYPNWYCAQYGLLVWQSALAHYLANRRTQRFSPNPDFNLKSYLRRHQAEIGPNRDAFIHYLRNAASNSDAITLPALRKKPR